MVWLTENWIWVLFGVAFIAMHLFGHGGHGGHGGGGCGGGHGGSKKGTAEPADRARPAASADTTNSHRH